MTRSVAVRTPAVADISPFRLLAIGGSAGAIGPLRDVLSQLPADFSIPVVVVQHLSATAESRLPFVLGLKTPLRCRWSEEGEVPRPGTLHVARPGINLSLSRDGRLRHLHGPKPRLGWPSVDIFFHSMAAAVGPAGIAAILSGMLYDGADGIASVRQPGGATIVQHPRTADYPHMPNAAVDLGRADLMLPLNQMADALTILAEQGGR